MRSAMGYHLLGNELRQVTWTRSRKGSDRVDAKIFAYPLKPNDSLAPSTMSGSLEGVTVLLGPPHCRCFLIDLPPQVGRDRHAAIAIATEPYLPSGDASQYAFAYRREGKEGIHRYSVAVVARDVLDELHQALESEGLPQPVFEPDFFALADLQGATSKSSERQVWFHRDGHHLCGFEKEGPSLKTIRSFLHLPGPDHNDAQHVANLFSLREGLEALPCGEWMIPHGPSIDDPRHRLAGCAAAKASGSLPHGLELERDPPPPLEKFIRRAAAGLVAASLALTMWFTALATREARVHPALEERLDEVVRREEALFRSAFPDEAPDLAMLMTQTEQKIERAKRSASDRETQVDTLDLFDEILIRLPPPRSGPYTVRALHVDARGGHIEAEVHAESSRAREIVKRVEAFLNRSERLSAEAENITTDASDAEITRFRVRIRPLASGEAGP